MLDTEVKLVKAQIRKSRPGSRGPRGPGEVQRSRRTAQIIAEQMNKWSALAAWNSPEGSKVVPASIFLKKRQDRNAFGTSCIRKEQFFWGRGVLKFHTRISLFWFSKSRIPP